MKLIEMQNHFYMKGFKPLRITACGGGCGQGWPHGCGGCGGYYDYSTAHFGNPPTWVSITKHEGTVCGVCQELLHVVDMIDVVAH